MSTEQTQTAIPEIDVQSEGVASLDGTLLDTQPFWLDVDDPVAKKVVTKRLNGKTGNGKTGNGKLSHRMGGHPLSDQISDQNGFESKQTIQFLYPQSTNGHPASNGTGSKQSEHGKRVSEEEYLRVYADHPDFNYEWNDGILEEKPVSNIAQLRHYIWFLRILAYYLEVYQLADAAMFEFLVEMKAGEKLVKRKPDLFVVRKDNPVPLHDEDESYKGVCDFCLELLSTSNKANIDRDVKKKKKEYALVGVREYVIINPDKDRMVVYRLNEQGKYKKVKPDAQGIVALETLPGFQFRWNDLFTCPPLRTLVEDSVYNHYILPEYKTLKERAEQEAQRAEQEAQRAEQEAQRAEQERIQKESALNQLERINAYLRSQGIDPTTLFA